MQEIAMNILDIAYNSIKAQANLIKIIIHDSSKLNIINIQIIDNGIGMDKTTVKNVIDPFYTTRTTRKVGLGVPMFKENIEATGGTFKIESEVGKGTHVTGEFIKNHLDTPPMVNIVETIITLIQADEKINYLFKYTSDKLEFILDTQEIKKILEGVPINQPEIIVWLKEYIKEGLQL